MICRDPVPGIVMQTAGVDTLESLLLDNVTTFSQQHVLDILQGVTRSMQHLHKESVIFGDLAAGNILVRLICICVCFCCCYCC